MKTKSLISVALAFVITIMTSGCGKYYNCECTTNTVIVTTSVGAGTVTTTSHGSYKGTSSSYERRMKKSEAQSACDHERAAIESNVYKGATDNGKVPLEPGSSITTECELK